MATVKEVFDYAIETDLSGLAHRVYWAISQQLVQLSDDSLKLDAVDYDENAISNLIEKNMLGIGKVKLFVIQMLQKEWYSFYFAENSLEAYQLHCKRFGKPTGKVVHAERLMIPQMHFADSGQEINLYDYRKNVVEFPTFIGNAKAGEHVLYRLGVSV
ncbi:hypothetical protein QT711_03490 [Sporosarcina saromensis]|uniref:Uncharacterized protein n=2 Tax=Sporosarcina saromensis TaxID=359365 RepID=A0ABU4G5I1_9BACL|nr:hypothetical protein [Sporosarcina saromensis]